MKLSVFTVMTPDLTPEELVTAAASAGIQGIEWRYHDVPKELAQEKPSFWRNNLATISPQITDAELDSLRQVIQQQGISSLSVTPYLQCGDLTGTEKVMQTASKLGAAFIRVGVPRYDRSRNYNTLFAEAIDYLNHVQELSQQYRVKALVETHHLTIAPSAGLAHRLVAGFNPDHIGVLHDAGNMVYEGFENYRMGMELLGPYLAHVHVKNAGWVRTDNATKNENAANGKNATKSDDEDWNCTWFPLHQGMVNWKQVISDLKAVGYDGFLGIEDFGGETDSRSLLNNFVQRIKSWSLEA
ncbi:sugar phosphate isomerase/epimerase family protein [Paenibacillus eucommiae]|uniref:Sugar phosphate isomerase/epimerase n=1 Tax=Paenibacillus eucommiae TaxID=1355755 RepID=A0ABS4IY18_9BACL|nr:sugar phosphate isomerase/epimerase [Paenibacillus eucommiae]MBP1992481.1 sugar phosphate isomerase/epimerase [Paenibacillus eucommiae]